MRRGEFYGRDAETTFSVLIKEVNLRLVKLFLLARGSGSVTLPGAMTWAMRAHGSA
jgi:hypothetical protein